MRGCNYSCTYCIVPAVRGRELYRPWEKILDEARAHAANGVQELMLLGQTVNSYRDCTGRDFADLLNEVGRIQGLRRVRFMSPHPFFLNQRMARAMAECAAVCPYLHLPVQSGSDRILKLMRRNYTRRDYLQKIRALKQLVPDLELSTDFIVGFPGETEQDFQDTLSLAQEADFCSAYCFKYSPREGTEAATLTEQIPEPLKEERLARLLDTVTKQSKKHFNRMRGRQVSVLLETPSEGRTEHNFKARLSRLGTPGQIVEAKVADMAGSTLLCA
jgi:tRNA-2-methylthio-N6-dimethylallyladenosine synthase